MTYQETIEYLYQQLPVFHRIGKVAFKANLDNTLRLCEHLGNPHKKIKTIHVAGTNGKGSSSHYLAAILQSAGYKTGLYTSPHLKSFTERIRINGIEIAEQKVIDFVADNREFITSLSPSFFELSVGMAFDYFAKEQIDIAVIEVGLGGRLDSTNIITPEICLITNISLDHTDILGDNLAQIASEKAGIIKENIPVVISETHVETKDVFTQKALLSNTNIYFAEDFYQVISEQLLEGKLHVSILDKDTHSIIPLDSELQGSYQGKNLLGVFKTINELIALGYNIPLEAIETGISSVTTLTGLKGRWQLLKTQPLMICDTAHNISGVTEILANIQQISYTKLWMILGFVSDKDINGILQLLPKDAHYVFCQASLPRALSAETLAKMAATYGLQGQVIKDVNQAIDIIEVQADPTDFIYVGGSTFVVSEIAML